MKRTTLFIDEAMERDLHALAQRRGAPVSALVRESLRRYLAEEHRRQKFSLRFLGAGAAAGEISPNVTSNSSGRV
jgi:predicted transcriptional regulator